HEGPDRRRSPPAAAPGPGHRREEQLAAEHVPRRDPRDDLRLGEPVGERGGMTETPSSPRSILVVDDNPSNLKLFTYLLAQSGYTVTTAASAEQALDVL